MFRSPDRQISLPDGRILGFCEYGDPSGRPVFYFHGWPGSRLEPQALVNTGHKFPVRVIAMDRPGYGLSSLHPGRSLKDWPRDVAELASSLGLSHYEVLGVSGGGPYAVACAALLPEIVTRATLVCSMGPCDVPGGTQGMAIHNRLLLALARRMPRVARFIASTGIDQLRRNDAFLPKSLIRRLPPADRRCLANPVVYQSLLENWREAFRSGNAGTLADGALLAQSWGFELADIRIPVTLYHGLSDIIVPSRMSAFLAANIPHSQAHYFDEDGHFSLPLERGGEIWRRQAHG